MFSKISDFYARIRPFVMLIAALGYGLLIVFCLVGILIGKGYLPVVALVITCLAWTAGRILQEASVAAQILRHALQNHEAPKADEDHDS